MTSRNPFAQAAKLKTSRIDSGRYELELFGRILCVASQSCKGSRNRWVAYARDDYPRISAASREATEKWIAKWMVDGDGELGQTFPSYPTLRAAKQAILDADLLHSAHLEKAAKEAARPKAYDLADQALTLADDLNVAGDDTQLPSAKVWRDGKWTMGPHGAAVRCAVECLQTLYQNHRKAEAVVDMSFSSGEHRPEDLECYAEEYDREQARKAEEARPRPFSTEPEQDRAIRLNLRAGYEESIRARLSQRHREPHGTPKRRALHKRIRDYVRHIRAL